MTVLPACVPQQAARKLEEMNPSLGSLQDRALDMDSQASFSLSGGRCMGLKSGILPWCTGSPTPEILGCELILLVRLGCLSSPSVTRLYCTLLQQLPPGSCVEFGVESCLLTGFLN